MTQPLLWRIMRSRARIGKPWKVSYGWPNTSSLTGNWFWSEWYHDQYDTKEEAQRMATPENKLAVVAHKEALPVAAEVFADTTSAGSISDINTWLIHLAAASNEGNKSKARRCRAILRSLGHVGGLNG